MTKAAILSMLGSCLCAFAAWGQSAYVPLQGELDITPSYTFQTFDRFYSSSSLEKLSTFGLSEITQHNATVAAEYGITEDVAVDVTLGYTHAHMDQVIPGIGNPNTIDGLNDTLIGARWRFLDERDHPGRVLVPTLTLRAGGIIAGTYDAGFINSPGDGASGGELSLLFGRYYEPWGLGAYGNAGYRILGSGVPDAFIGGLGLYKTFGGVTVNVGYRRYWSTSGINFDSPEFTFNRFQNLREISDSIEYGVGYTDSGGRSYNLNFLNVLNGQNVGQSFNVNASVTLPFEFGPGPSSPPAIEPSK
jgi:hypothetical protein